MRSVVGLGMVAGMCAAVGCGDPLVDDHFLGDATIRLQGVLQGSVPVTAHPTVAVLWLGYSALADRALVGVESTVLPISRVEFPPRFSCDLLSPPPGAGAYALPSGLIVPAFVRLGLLVIFDDADQDGLTSADRRRDPIGCWRKAARMRCCSSPRRPAIRRRSMARARSW